MKGKTKILKQASFQGPLLNHKKSKMATRAPKEVAVKYLKVISLDSEFQLNSSSNG